MQISNTQDKLECFNNPNWVDSALKRCDQFHNSWSWYCGICCNDDICDRLKREEREKAIAEMQESLLNMQELKVKICEPESNLNGSVLSIDTIPYLSSFYTPREFYVHDLAAETPIVAYDTPMNNGTWRMVAHDDGTTTIQYVSGPDW